MLTAFFLEATFLGVMLFGMNRVPGWMHVTSAVLVAAGTSLSAFWILKHDADAELKGIDALAPDAPPVAPVFFAFRVMVGIVAGVLRTAEAVGTISGAKLGASLTGYLLTYTLMLVAYMVVLTHLAGKGSAREDPRAAVMAGEMAR